MAVVYTKQFGWAEEIGTGRPDAHFGPLFKKREQTEENARYQAVEIPVDQIKVGDILQTKTGKMKVTSVSTEKPDFDKIEEARKAENGTYMDVSDQGNGEE